MKSRIRMAIAVGVSVAALFGAGGFLGYKAGLEQRNADAGLRAAASARVMEIVTERNPGARILDWAGWPETLFRESARAGLDYRLVLALIEKESGFRPDAVGAAGEVGLMQVMPATAALVAERLLKVPFLPPVRAKSGHYLSLGDLGDAHYNLRVGVAYLRAQMDRYALLPVALRAYNRAPGKAEERRPGDRYAEDIALGYLRLTQTLP